MIERWLAFKIWIADMNYELGEKLYHALASYNKIKKWVDNITAELNLRVLEQADIIGVTTSRLARNVKLLCGVNVKLLICEEAGKVLEAHLLTALLPSLEHDTTGDNDKFFSHWNADQTTLIQLSNSPCHS
jgi:hypothetical protein